MSHKAQEAIENAIRCLEYARRGSLKHHDQKRAYDNARQALDYAEDRAPSREQRQVIGSLRLRLPEWTREEAST